MPTSPISSGPNTLMATEPIPFKPNTYCRALRTWPLIKRDVRFGMHSDACPSAKVSHDDPGSKGAKTSLNQLGEERVMRASGQTSLRASMRRHVNSRRGQRKFPLLPANVTLQRRQHSFFPGVAARQPPEAVRDPDWGQYVAPTFSAATRAGTRLDCADQCKRKVGPSCNPTLSPRLQPILFPSPRSAAGAVRFATDSPCSHGVRSWRWRRTTYGGMWVAISI